MSFHDRDGKSESADSASKDASPEGLRHPGILPETADERIFADFLSKQDGVLDEVESLVIQLEQSTSPERLQELRRLFHTLKGEAALLGLDEVERVCHGTEDLFSDETACLDADTLLRVRDWLRAMFDFCCGRGGEPGPFDTSLLEPKEPDPNPLRADFGLLADFVTRAAEHLETVEGQLLTAGADTSDEETLNAIFRAFHTIKSMATLVSLEHISRVAHQAENLLDKARRREILLSGPVADLVFEVTDAIRDMVSSVDASVRRKETPGEVEADEGLLRRIAALSGRSSGRTTAAAPPSSAALVKQHSDKLPRMVRETVKVDAERLDRLLDAIGELVIAESMVSESVKLADGRNAYVAGQLSQLDKITRELQETGMSLRMVPIRSTFQRMARLVRDLSKRSGKQVELLVSGEETELDKSVVDRIGDPLVHLVRNAVGHGIEEDPAERLAEGKPECGRVFLRAHHKAGNIHIEVADDGVGLDRDSILAKAREMGLCAEQSVPEADLFNFIFEPGFTTAKSVSDVSGRGVGMDVVRRNVEALRGQVEIESKPGEGSRFTIKLPLTLAIIDGMVVSLGDERYVIPTLSIVRSVQPRESDLSSVFERREMLSIGDELIPLFRLDRLFGVCGAEQCPQRAIVVVVEENGQRAGVLVDGLVGQQQVVIKNLTHAFQSIEGLAGSAIMPDGKVGLILDVAGLIALAHEEQLEAVGATNGTTQ